MKFTFVHYVVENLLKTRLPIIGTQETPFTWSETDAHFHNLTASIKEVLEIQYIVYLEVCSRIPDLN